MKYNNNFKGINLEPRISQKAIDYFNERGIKVYKKIKDPNDTTGKGFISVQVLPAKNNTDITGNTSSSYTSLSEELKKPAFSSLASTHKPENQIPRLAYKDSLPTVTKSSSPPDISASVIKTKAKDVLVPKYGVLNTRHLFDDIDDKEVEKYVPMAEQALSGVGNSTSTSRKIKPGSLWAMALSYAADAAGKKNEASKAREASYDEKINFFDDFNKNTNNSKPTYNRLIRTYANDKNTPSSASATSIIKRKSGPRYVVNVDSSRLNVRNAPSSDSNVIGKLNNGDEVHFTGNKTAKINGHMWAEVEYDGNKGWLRRII